MHKAQQGFTMIELVMVIVILGILAAVAMPRFYDLQTDARIAKAEAIFGTVRSASAIAHSAYLVKGDIATSVVQLEDKDVALTNGYPTTASILVAAGLDGTNDDDAKVDTATLGTIKVLGATDPNACKITYGGAASAGEAPSIALVKTGC